MQRDHHWPLTGGKVLHVVGDITDEVNSFLGPATHALAQSGMDQVMVVVVVDEVRHRHHVAHLHHSVQLVLVPRLRNPLLQARAMFEACSRVLTGVQMHAVHLHGMLPCLVGACAVRASGVRSPIFYSPHGSRSLGSMRWLGVIAMFFAWPVLRPSRSAAIVNTPHETLAFDKWRSAELVESPVTEAFLSAERREARHPLIITGGRLQSGRSVELFAQLAVLLSSEDLRISFNWIGAVDPVSHRRLTAAGVGVFDANDDTECASRMATSWIYVAPDATRGFPVYLVQAMAAGLPCVAFDCPQHREVLVDGETGFLCSSERDMMERIAKLVDNPAQRVHIGEAARAAAKHRFGELTFNAKLLAAYSLPG